ncbi:MAG: hypothetical protein PHV49_05585 [Alistipes sp.]|nr:hypothetical protein [Alistipes sp.]
MRRTLLLLTVLSALLLQWGFSVVAQSDRRGEEWSLSSNATQAAQTTTPSSTVVEESSSKEALFAWASAMSVGEISASGNAFVSGSASGLGGGTLLGSPVAVHAVHALEERNHHQNQLSLCHWQNARHEQDRQWAELRQTGYYIFATRKIII